MGNRRIVLVAHKTHAYAAPKWLESSTFKYLCHAFVVLLDLESLQPNGGVGGMGDTDNCLEGTSFCNISFMCA